LCLMRDAFRKDQRPVKSVAVKLAAESAALPFVSFSFWFGSSAT
jgi:hypothetical protein